MSILTTFARLALVPLIVGVLCLTIPAANISKVLAFWVVSTALLSLFFAGDAHTKLARFGRELLLRPQMEKLPHIEGEWSFINWDEILDDDTPRISLVTGR